MRKAISIIALVSSVLLVGCGENNGGSTAYTTKSDKNLIEEAYKKAVSGDASAVIVVDKRHFKTELEDKKMPSNYLYRVESKNAFLGGEYKECSAVSDTPVGDLATIHQNCGDPGRDGISYAKKVNGEWKIPVDE